MVYGGGFETGKWLELIEKHQATCLYTSPTMMRSRRNELSEALRGRELCLKRNYSAGEPLNPEVISWAESVFGAEVFDNYWQTETGSPIIANRQQVKIIPFGQNSARSFTQKRKM
jgi:acetyl-CoA synthetase